MATNLNAGTQMFYTRPSDGATYCFSPVPLLAESKEFSTTADGNQRLGTIHQVTFNGWLVATLPALSGLPPNSSCLQVLDRKSDQLCAALTEDYGNLLIVDSSGYPVIAENPRIVSLDFAESQMVNTRQYTLVVQYNTDFNDGTKVSEFTDTWDFSLQQDDTISASHSVSAVGVPDPILGTSPFDNAREFVLSKVSGVAVKPNSYIMRIPFVSPLVDIENLTAYNHIYNESIDLTAGSYQISETWVLSSGAFKDDRTIERSFSLNELNVLIETTSINGTVLGYGDTTFDRITNAINGFNTFVAPQIGFNSSSGVASKSITQNRFNGTVSYSLGKIPDDPDQQLDSRSISRSFERQDDGSVTQTVSTSSAIRAGSASGIESAITYCFANNYPIDSAEPIFDASLSGNIVSVSTSRDDVSKSFSLTRVFQDQSTALYREEFTVDRAQSTDTSVTTVTVQGSVFGLGVETGTKSNVRFLSASGAFFGPGGIESQIYSRAAALIPAGACIGDNPVTSTISTSLFAGTIGYNQVFESRFKTANNNVLREEIDIGLTNPSDVIAIIPIPGKIDGPVLQDQQTQTGKTKTLNITYTMRSNTDICSNTIVPNNSLLATAQSESNILVNNTPTMNGRGEKPESSKVFKTNDQVGWNRQTLVFTRQITWQYL